MTDPYERSRHAHRVFRARKGADGFNPFRHIPWDYKISDDLEHGDQGASKLLSQAARFFDDFRALSLTVLWHKEPIERQICGCSFLLSVPEVPFTWKNQLQRTICTSWINVLLICVPAGLALQASRGPSVEVFVLNFVAEVPLWFMCDYGLEEIEKYLGPTLSDLIDIFTTNTVQIISSLLLLIKSKQVPLLQTSLVGGILSNILVLLGLSFLLGGLPNHEQRFNRLGAQGASTLLSIAATSLLIPTSVKLLGQTSQENLVKQSRGVAVVLLFVYVAYTFCQMVTHKKEYSGTSSGHSPTFEADHGGAAAAERCGTNVPSRIASPSTEGPAHRGERGPGFVTDIHPPLWASRAHRPDANEVRGPHLSLSVAILVFGASIALLYLCIDATVDSISALTERTPLTPIFVGLILLPIPNCDFAPISLAVDDFLEQTMRYTVGRSVQTALLVEPLVVLLAWWLGIGDVTLAFDGFEVVSLFTTILLLGFLMVDAKVHWVHGVLLLADWVLIGVAAFFVSPDSLK
ncbi:hypothetical protein BR93DRAFT_489662 [Coniochaeta sp. PMI_546]|nr:hypothetical protein BR93DRAFT_489662 [Coniochaeta sp. PMI_546]